MFFFRVQQHDHCPCPSSSSSLSINTVTSTASTSSASPMTSILTSPSYSVTISSSRGQGTFISNWLVCSCRICRWSNILSVIIFWVWKTCKPPHHTSHISLVSLSCPSSLPPPLLSPSLLSSLLSTNPFLSHTSPPSSNPFLTASWWAIRSVTSIMADHKEQRMQLCLQAAYHL